MSTLGRLVLPTNDQITQPVPVATFPINDHIIGHTIDSHVSGSELITTQFDHTERPGFKRERLVGNPVSSSP